MELEKLTPIILMIVAVGMLIGIGLITLDKFGATTYYNRYDYNDTITLGANITAVTLDYGNITSVDAVWNGTSVAFPSECYSIDTTNGIFNFTNSSDSCNVLTQTSYVIYDYRDYDTATKTAVSNTSNELAKIPSDWLGLIVTVVILAIILMLVIRSFGAAQR